MEVKVMNQFVGLTLKLVLDFSNQMYHPINSTSLIKLTAEDQTKYIMTKQRYNYYITIFMLIEWLSRTRSYFLFFLECGWVQTLMDEIYSLENNINTDIREVLMDMLVSFVSCPKNGYQFREVLQGLGIFGICHQTYWGKLKNAFQKSH